MDDDECVECLDEDGDGFYQDINGSGCDPVELLECDIGEHAFYRNPDAEETCDGWDNDCDTLVDEDFDLDEDGYFDGGGCETTYEIRDCFDAVSTGICADGTCANCDPETEPVECGECAKCQNPDAQEFCDGIDQNCDEAAEADEDGDGYFLCSEPTDCVDDTEDDPFFCDDCPTDCLEADPICFFCAKCINPGVSEFCGDGIDNDCTGVIDDGCAGALAAQKIFTQDEILHRVTSTQSQANKMVDILFVVDNSDSMEGKQREVGTKLAYLIYALSDLDPEAIDYHIGVTTTTEEVDVVTKYESINKHTKCRPDSMCEDFSPPKFTPSLIFDPNESPYEREGGGRLQYIKSGDQQFCDDSSGTPLDCAPPTQPFIANKALPGEVGYIDEAYHAPVPCSDPGLYGIDCALKVNSIVGMGGSQIESGMGAAELAMTNPAYLGEGKFIRHNAPLIVIFFSDSDDHSHFVRNEPSYLLGHDFGLPTQRFCLDDDLDWGYLVTPTWHPDTGVLWNHRECIDIGGDLIWDPENRSVSRYNHFFQTYKCEHSGGCSSPFDLKDKVKLFGIVIPEDGTGIGCQLDTAPPACKVTDSPCPVEEQASYAYRYIELIKMFNGLSEEQVMDQYVFNFCNLQQSGTEQIMGTIGDYIATQLEVSFPMYGADTLYDYDDINPDPETIAVTVTPVSGDPILVTQGVDWYYGDKEIIFIQGHEPSEGATIDIEFFNNPMEFELSDHQYVDVNSVNVKIIESDFTEHILIRGDDFDVYDDDYDFYFTVAIREEWYEILRTEGTEVVIDYNYFEH